MCSKLDTGVNVVVVLLVISGCSSCVGVLGSRTGGFRASR